MIELKNVKKIYKSKKSIDTVALNDINLKINNKGLLFIVGKSGSGKSTLLNLIGGLDCIDSGELLINGNDISKFTKNNFDSYRNTYIGFIFQEFNILEQYNVYENIELSLKLQNKSTSMDIIDSLLEKLGLKGLGNRKINELSGGQKQRVAIARALIKNPKVILADEPTGNLDKNSSEQIFSILKEISKEKLVIVVSHDDESAKKYADRIVEIEDGNIVSDSEQLVTDEFENIELKKSKLPLSYALKMAINSFKTKPFKLFMTILLTAISLIFMGITVNCAFFDKTMLVVNTMKDNNNYIYDVRNSDFGYMGSISNFKLNEIDINDIEKLTNATVNPVYTLYDDGNRLAFEFGENTINNKYYKFEPYYLDFVEINDSRILGEIIGNEPTKDNEIVIHKYFADYIIKFGIMTTDNTLYFPKSYDELINSKQEIKLGENKVIITGIINDNDSLFTKAKETGNFESDKLESYFYNRYVSNAYKIYVNGFTETATLRINKNSLLNHVAIIDNGKNENQHYLSNNINALNNEISVITSSGISYISSLKKNEVILSIDGLKTFESNFDSKLNKYLETHSGGIYEELLKEFVSIYLKESPNSLKLYLSIYVDSSLEDKDSDINIIGISLDGNNYISYQYIEEYEPVLKNMGSVKIFDNNTKNLTKSLNKLVFRDFFEGSDIEYGTYYNYTVDINNQADLSNVMGTYKGLSIYILIISLVFTLFTLLLFSNFISVSISYCKKEIGILRALGATSKDVIKIFVYESLIIGLISWILSIIGWYTLCGILNNSLFGNMYYTLNGIVTHPLVPIIMLIYTIVIALVITIISISRITNIKPIDAILNK